MSDTEEDINQNNFEEQFNIEEIEEVHKSQMNTLDKNNMINNSQNFPIEDNQNYYYNSNENEIEEIKITMNDMNDKDNKDSIIDTNNLIESNEIVIKDHNDLENNDINNDIDNNDMVNNIMDNNIMDNNINNYIINNEIEYNTNKEELEINIEEGPINLIEFNHKNFVLNENALNILRSIKENLIIVSIVGKARTGKSYLMNLLLNNNQSKYPGHGFEISSRLNSCTRGIWLWNTPRQKPNSSAKIIFIDSEGTNSVDLSTKTYDSKIFALIVLISSLFIYNTNGNIDEKSISDLALAAHLSNTVATNAIEDKDIVISELAPKFIWVLRDFVLDKIDPDSGEEISSDEYLELCLRNKSTKNKSMENNLIRENIIKYFKERECVTLPRPVEQEEDLHKLNEIPFSELKPNFREEFLNLKRKVYETSKVKKIGNKRINGPILVELLTSFINSLNSKIIPNINTAIDNIIINEIEKAYDKCIKLWKENYIKIKGDKYNIKDLYDIKYFIINEFNIVINENREIKYNNQYLEIFKDNRNKLENEIQNDIQKINTINNNKKNSLLNDILNKHKNIEYNSNLNVNNLEQNHKDLVINTINENYSNFISDIKNNCNNLDEEKAFDTIINKDSEYNTNGIKQIISELNQDYENKIGIINEQINEDELFCQRYDISQFNQINETLNQRYELLSEELDAKEKEVFGLIGKYTKLMEKKEKILSNNNVPKRGDPNMTTLRSQKFQNGYCGITVETNEKGCGCELGDFCIIF